MRNSDPYPESLVQLAGTRRVLESAHKLIGATWGEEGTTRTQHAWIADPDLIRTLDTGQACYIHRGGATFVQVARPRPSPLSLPAAPSPSVIIPPPAPPGDEESPPPPGPRGAGEPGRRVRPGGQRVNPFTVLGLPTSPHLTDEQVRAAWRVIAAATHPDRPDGGDVPRYTAAATAYAQLRTAWGRSEAYADLAADQPYVPTPASLPVSPGGRLLCAARLVPARIRHGRPWHLVARALAAAVLSLLVVHLLPGQPSGPAIVTGLVTWFGFTGRGDLAPPPGW